MMMITEDDLPFAADAVVSECVSLAPDSQTALSEHTSVTAATRTNIPNKNTHVNKLNRLLYLMTEQRNKVIHE